MPHNEELFEKYELLLPGKFDGGYLVIALYQGIKKNELSPHFTAGDIKNVLTQLSEKYGENISQSERIIKQLLHFYLKSVPGEPGKYYLTDFAEELIELLLRKLENPYKSYPLKQTFSKYFFIESGELTNIYELESRFGREFVTGHKRIINNHLEDLDDELRASTEELNIILDSQEESATVLVRNFVNVFRKFGERAEDITNAIADKDHFLHTLRMHVDRFYISMAEYKPQNNEADDQVLEKLKKDWSTAKDINDDLQGFFRSVDNKINRLRRQIIFASDKLSELQEQFSSRSNFRLRVKRLLSLALKSAELKDKEIQFFNGFPQKAFVVESAKLFYPGRYDFILPEANKVIEIPEDKAYEQQERWQIERDIRRQQTINEWIAEGKSRLEVASSIEVAPLIQEIMTQENDFAVAHQVAIELTQYVSDSNAHRLIIEQIAEPIKNTNLIIWKMQLLKTPTTPSSQKNQ